MRQVGRDFQAYVTVLPGRTIVNRAQYVGDGTNVCSDKRFVDVARALARTDELVELLIVGSTMTDGFLKNGRVRCDAYHTILVQQPLKLPGDELCSVDVIVPDALS